ncbi:MAG: ApeI family dehydratase [Treponema sp.]
MTQNLHGIVDEKIVGKKENSVSLEFSIPESSDFFDGHFPEFKLLPAVAQFEVVTRFSRKYFNTQRYVPAIKRIKFSNPIRPDTNVHLDLEYRVEKSSVSFSMQDADIEGKVYSSGSFSVIPE